MNIPNPKFYNPIDCPRRTAQDSIAVNELLNVVESSVSFQAPHTAAFFREHPTALSYQHAPSTAFPQSYPGHSWDETRLHADLLAEHVPQSPFSTNYYAALGQHLIPPEVGWTLQADSPATWRGYPPRTHVQTQPTTLQPSQFPLAGGNAFTSFNSFAFAPTASSHQTDVIIHAIDGYTPSVHANVPIPQTSSSSIPRDAIPSKTSPNYIAWHQESEAFPLFMNQYTPPRTRVSPLPPPMSIPVPRTDPTSDPAAGLLFVAPSPHVPTPSTPPSTQGTHSPPITGSSPPQSDATAAGKDTSCRTCPTCNFIQKRKVDMKRHIRTHAKEKPWTCCGLPLGEESDSAGRMTRTRRGNGKVRALGGMKFLGGCGKRFSRRDALQKHLRRFPRCVGDPHAAWHSGNADA